jgi:hypothetical protein
MENITLLQKAKLFESSRTQKKFINDEDLELAIAWAKGEVSIKQVKLVLSLSSHTRVHTFLADCFKTYINTEEQLNK